MKYRTLLQSLFLATVTTLSTGFPIFGQAPWTFTGFGPPAFTHEQLKGFRRHLVANHAGKFRSDPDDDDDDAHNTFIGPSFGNMELMYPNFPDDGAHTSLLLAPFGDAAPMFSYFDILGNPVLRPVHNLWSAEGESMHPLNIPGISRSLFPIPHMMRGRARQFEDRRPVVKDDDEEQNDQDDEEEDEDDDAGNEAGDDTNDITQERRDVRYQNMEARIRKQIDLKKAEIEHEKAMIRQSMQARAMLPALMHSGYVPNRFPPMQFHGPVPGPRAGAFRTMPAFGGGPSFGHPYGFYRGELTIGTDGRFQRVHIPRGWGWKMDLPDNTHIAVS